MGFDCIGKMQGVAVELGKSQILEILENHKFWNFLSKSTFGLGRLVHGLLGEHELDLVSHYICHANLRKSCTGPVLSHLETVDDAGGGVLGQRLVEAVGVVDDGGLEAWGPSSEAGS